jgi:hypothetical protein
VNQQGSQPATCAQTRGRPSAGLSERIQLSAGAGELLGRRGEVCRREEPSSYQAGLRAHGSNHRFHRLLGHAVARAPTTAPRLTGLGPAAPGILMLQGWRRKRRPGRCRVNLVAARFVVARAQGTDRRRGGWSRNVSHICVSRPGFAESRSPTPVRCGPMCPGHNSRICATASRPSSSPAWRARAL